MTNDLRCWGGSLGGQRGAAAAWGFGAAEEVFIAAAIAGESHDVIWFWRYFIRFIFEEFRHNIVPDGSGSGDS